MQKITPFLWFDTQAEEAVNFYTSIFQNSKTGKTQRYDTASAKVSGRPEGSVMTAEFQLEGQDFTALNGGPIFKFSPAISFFVGCATEDEVQKLYDALVVGGSVMMPLQEYPFSKKYAWIQDRFGVSWQLSVDAAPRSQKITPSLMFVGDKFGQAEEAMKFYTSVFPNSSIATIARYAAGEGDKEGMVKYAEFSLNGYSFLAMESSLDHKFGFSLATSFVVPCETQQEIDFFWEKLSAVKESEQCGWLQDKYGVSWQIVPTALAQYVSGPDAAGAGRAMQAMLQMKKIDIEVLRKAYEG